MNFPTQQSNQVNLYRELLKDEKMIDACVPLLKAKFREAVLDKGRCSWETLSIHELLKMLQDHQHKFFIRGMNNRRDVADLVGISMMILSKCTEGEFKHLDGIPLPTQSFQTPCPYGLDNASEKFDEECDAFLRKMYRGEEELSFAPPFDQKILDRTKIRTARKRDKSGEFTIKGERFRAEFEIAMSQAAFASFFENGFYTPEQFGFDSSVVMWNYYAYYYEVDDLVYVHKIISISVDVGLEDQSS